MSLVDIKVRYNFDLSKIQKDLNDIKTSLGDKAVVSILNKTAAQAKTRMSEAIRDEYNISASLVRDRIKVGKAQRKGATAFTALVIGNPEPGGGKRSFNVIRFLETKVTIAEGRRRRKAGTLSQLRFKIKKAGGKTTIKGAFIGNQGRTVFIRTGPGRLPIKAVQTIGIPQMFTTKRNTKIVLDWIKANFPRIANSEIQHYLHTR